MAGPWLRGENGVVSCAGAYSRQGAGPVTLLLIGWCEYMYLYIYILFIFNYVYAIYLSMEIYICICNLFICENINIMFLCVKLKKTWSTLWCYNSVSSIYIYIYVLNQLFVWSFAWYLRETMEKNAKWENYAGIPWPWKIMGQLFGIWLVSCDWTTKNPTNHLQGCSPPSKFFCTPPNYRYNQQKPNS